MKRLIDKVHSKLREQTPRQPQQQQEDTSLAAQLPSPLDIVRYRYHHGVNLGGIFVLEKWLYPSMFDPSAEGDSELDAIIAYASFLHFVSLSILFSSLKEYSPAEATP